jgi:hypothetical protein
MLILAATNNHTFSAIARATPLLAFFASLRFGLCSPASLRFGLQLKSVEAEA